VYFKNPYFENPYSEKAVSGSLRIPDRELTPIADLEPKQSASNHPSLLLIIPCPTQYSRNVLLIEGMPSVRDFDIVKG
jgi:hypothetical protein